MNTIPEAIQAIKDGQMIIIVDDADRENEGDFVCAAATATAEQINFIAQYGKGLICAPMGWEIADRLDLPPMTRENTDPNHTNFTVSVDHKDTTTGISAFDRMITINELANPRSTPQDFRRPGHVFPLVARPHGVLERKGHTEATVDLMRLAGLPPVGVCCEIMADNGRMMQLNGLEAFAKAHKMVIISVDALRQYRLRNLHVTREASSNLPTQFGEFQVNVYTNPMNPKNDLAIIKGPLVEPVCVRLHSECLTGDTFGSLKCDCGPQLHAALNLINERHGVVLYLRQEGRGIGIVNKIKAYHLQDEGFDTVEANVMLGFKPDLRTYEVAAAILRDLGIKKVNLITNNPDKVKQLTEFGIDVVGTTPLHVGVNPKNIDYLRTKRDRMGHQFGEEIKNDFEDPTISDHQHPKQ